jgi:channel protein (hemolysin III family)
VRDTIPIAGFAEPVSSLTHFVGALVFAVASFWLLNRGRGSAPRMASLVVFSLGAVFLLLLSGTYHMLSHDSVARPIVQRLDHSAIFVLIAASFTPTHTILFRGWWRTGVLLLIWTVAILGITLKMVYFHDMPRWLGNGLYLAMGWLGFFSCWSLWRRCRSRWVAWPTRRGLFWKRSVGQC